MDIASRPSLRRLALFFDALGLIASLLIAWLVHIGLQAHVAFLKDSPAFSDYMQIMVLVLPVWLYLIPSLGLDRVLEERWSRGWLLARLLRLQGLGALALVTILFLTQIVINRSIIVLFLACSFLILYLLRVAIQLRLDSARLEERRSRLLIAGIPAAALDAFLAKSAEAPRPPHIAGRVGPAPDTPDTSGALPFLGPMDRLPHILQEHAIDGVLFFAPYRGPEDAPKAMEHCEKAGIPASFHFDPLERVHSAPRFAEVSGVSFIIYEVSPKSSAALMLKHLGDLVGAALVLLMVLPLFVLAMALIRIRMGPPIFFSQERAGLNGRVFRMFKLRTMVLDAEVRKAELADRNEMSGPVFKVTDDERVTPLGRFLRKWSIDELPQLINVLQGTMSLIGPRPLPVSEQAKIHGWHRRRLSMRPGITGLWQVSGRNEVDFEDWMRLDLRYIDEWSLSGDLLILFRTFGAVFGRKGAK